MPRGMKRRSGFRRALWGSAALHALAAGALVALFHFDRDPPPAAPGIRTTAEPQVRVTLADTDTGAEVQAPAPSQAAPSAEPAAHLPRGPVAPNVPHALPPELLALIRKPASAEPVGGAVTEVPVAPGAANPTTDANVKPAAASTGATVAKAATPIHGALRPNQTVVYVLDSSGSMGANGMFDAARAQLVATLKAQPASARFQVIAYAAQPAPLLASDGGAVPLSEANVKLAAQQLAALEPRGKSNHLAAVRAAAAFRPDVILVLTDAHDLTAATVKPLLTGAPSATVFVGVVTPDGVQPPRAVK
jgi:von Willebrand factor type A domain